MMKKFHLLAIIILIASMVAACGGAPSPSDAGAPAQTEARAATQAPAPTTVPSTATTAPTATVAPACPDGYTLIVNKTGVMQICVPAAWTYVDTNWGMIIPVPTPVNYPPQIWMLASVDGLFTSLGPTQPGVKMGASRGWTKETIDAQLDSERKIQAELDFGHGDCVYDERDDYKDSVYEGKYDLYHCDKDTLILESLLVRPIDNPSAYELTLDFALNLKDPNLKNGARVMINSFAITGDVP